MTGMYSYNHAIFEIAKAFDEILEEVTPSHRVYETGLLLLDHNDSKHYDEDYIGYYKYN